MGTVSRAAELRAQRRSEGGDVSGRHVRAPWSLPLFATFATLAFVAVTLSPPYPTAYAAVTAPGVRGDIVVQTLRVDGEFTGGVGRDGFTITDPPPPPPVASAAPAAGVPDPGTAQAIAYAMLQSMGWGDDQYNCLVALWNRESGWNVYAHNESSGAYGIPQALPGSKMASAGADWATNPTTQITWGLGYISGRYGTPCGAWEASETQGWY